MSKLVSETVVATTIRKEDLEIVKLCVNLGISIYCGSEEDVLDRYYQAARLFKAEHIVRITSDCPLIDPKLIDEIIDYYLNNIDKFDFVHNGPSYPDGIVETEVFSFTVLEKAWKGARLTSEREHVTSYIWKNPDLFKSAMPEYKENLSNIRLVVDDENDFQIVSEIFKNLYEKDKIFHMNDILNFLKKHPKLLELNRQTIRNEGYIRSLEKDKLIM